MKKSNHVYGLASSIIKHYEITYKEDNKYFYAKLNWNTYTKCCFANFELSYGHKNSTRTTIYNRNFKNYPKLTRKMMNYALQNMANYYIEKMNL